jgi:hypothetical protein
MIQTRPYRGRWYKKTVAIIFMAILFLPLLQMLLGFCKEPENIEKRVLSPYPNLREHSVDGVYNYVHDYQAWFNDHFGFRKLFVRTNAMINYYIFHTSPKSMVVVGKDGWLFYDNQRDGKNLDDYFGNVNFTRQQLSTIHTRLDTLRAKMASHKLPFLFVLTSSKHSIYPEYLPFNMSRTRAAVTRADQIDSIFHVAGVPLIDMRSVLIRNKSAFPYPLYYRTDSHWNELGAYLGYKSIMDWVKTQIPVIKVHALADYKVEERSDNGSGDLANYIFMGGLLPDREIDLEPKFHEQAQLSHEKYPIPSTIFIQKNDTTLPHLLMFHDSFTRALRPFLSESFSRNVFVWTDKIDYSIIDKEKPNIVVIEFVERYSDMLLKL